MEYKSLQWFGATVRAHGSSILVRAQQAQGRSGLRGTVVDDRGARWGGVEGGRRGPVELNLEPPPPVPSQACAPLYSWRTEKEPLNDPVGTCYLSTDNFTRILEYAPCRSGRTRGGRCPSPVSSVSPHSSAPISLDAHCLVQGGPFLVPSPTSSPSSLSFAA